MNRQAASKPGERGQALVLLVLCLSLFLIAGVGLALDGSMLYTEHHRAQTAADAAAQAGAMDFFYALNNKVAFPGWSSGSFTCTGSNTSTPPCQYASMNGFGTANDTVTVDYPQSVNGIPTCTVNTSANTPCGYDYIRVTVTRNVNMSFMRIAGFRTEPVTATAIAAITQSPTQIPIVVTHPNLVDAFSTNGNVTLQICGGPTRSIQIDSNGTVDKSGRTVSTPEGMSLVGLGNAAKYVVDLSKAGPGGNGSCSGGTGGDFGSVAPPNKQSTNPTTWLNAGTTGHYLQPTTSIPDPLANLTEPSNPGSGAAQSSTPTPVANGQTIPGTTCSCATTAGCTVYKPGLYTGGIAVSSLVYFMPGLYYIVDGTGKTKNVGFSDAAGADMEMLSSYCALGTVPNDTTTGPGMLVFNDGSSTFSVGANGVANLVGPPSTSIYKDVLFWTERTLQGSPKTANTFGGGGALTLTGSIYINQTNPTYSNYQSVLLQGHSGSNTTITGEIITNVLSLGGSSSIIMTLDSYKVPQQVKVALVQ